MPSVRGIEIVDRYVADIARAIAFYENAFGLSFTRYGDEWAEGTLADGVRFGFHLAHEGAPPQAAGRFISFVDPDGYRVHVFERKR